MAERRRVLDDPGILLCAVICVIGLGGFLLWASIAPLEEGVVASGHLVVRGDRKQIAHYEGGIVRHIHVTEGTEVAEGAPLITLEPVQSEAARDEIAQSLFTARAKLARLEALRSELGEPALPTQTFGLRQETTEAIIAQQLRLFGEQRATFDAERQVLSTRQGSSRGRASDLAVQLAATRENLEVAGAELARRREALTEQLDTVDNIQRAEREVLVLRSEIAGLSSERNLALRQAEEAGDQLIELETRFRRTIEEEAADAASETLALTERLEANDDRLSRTVLTAPLAGIVLGLEANTVGGVIRAGEPIMEIVPQDSRIIALVRLPPNDREAVRRGQVVIAQLSAYKQYRVPRISGEVLNVSADLRVDPATGASFYEARVLLDPETLRGLPQVELLPGLPVEAFIASGRKRTMLDYMFEPISSSVQRGLRFR